MTGYLLDPSHPKGGSKAGFFARFGFDRATPWLLEAALRAHPDTNDVAKVTRTAHGLLSVVECNLATPDGRNPCIRSVWLLEDGFGYYRLVTAYPVERP